MFPKPPPRIEDHVRHRLLDAADRYALNVSVSEVDLLTRAAFDAVVECGAARLENRPPAPGLSSRETQVLERMALGLTNAAIADGLGLSIESVKSHVETVLRRLGAHNRIHAAMIGVRRGLLDLDCVIEPNEPAPDRHGVPTGGHVGHGTLAGYEAHLAAGTEPCKRCHAAHGHHLPIVAPRPPRHPSAAETIAISTRRDTDGHLLWTSPQRTVFINGRKYLPARASWLTHCDRVPRGYVQAGCGVAGCVEPTHLADAVDRQRAPNRVPADFA